MTTKSPSGYHYFVHNGMSRSDKIQSWIVNELLNSKLSQEKRESSVQWELKHSSGVIQLARLLAQKRNINEELAEIAAGLHDVHVIVNGTYEDHARSGAKIARELLEQSKQFSSAEINQIDEAIAQHSDKHIYSNNALVELIKDADTLDCFFYGDTVYDYKKEQLRIHYYKRIVSLRNELGLPENQYFRDQLKSRGVC